MDIVSTDFFSALFAIIVIDLMLAGDNAIVIALAARNVPQHLQQRAILWGMFGAIAVRIAMTLVVVWLLKIPGLLFVGGVLLVWIAYRLLLPEDGGNKGEHASAANSFWGAMRTIVIADAVMGLDNVLAVAGAAHGSFLLVVLGLLISIPIVIWGSGFILRYVERYPSIVYFGAGVLAWTAANMITGEPQLKKFFAANSVIVPLFYVFVVAGVLWAGFARNSRWLEEKIAARLGGFALSDDPSGNRVFAKRVVLPVDGSPNALQAVHHAIAEYRDNPALDIHVLCIQHPFKRFFGRLLASADVDRWSVDEAAKVLAPCRELFEQHGVPRTEHIVIGEKAEMIAEVTRRLQCDAIVMGAARHNSLTGMLEASVTNKVLELSAVPAKIIRGEMISNLERFGVPLGIGSGVTAVVMLALT